MAPIPNIQCPGLSKFEGRNTNFWCTDVQVLWTFFLGVPGKTTKRNKPANERCTHQADDVAIDDWKKVTTQPLYEGQVFKQESGNKKNVKKLLKRHAWYKRHNFLAVTNMVVDLRLKLFSFAKMQHK